MEKENEHKPANDPILTLVIKTPLGVWQNDFPKTKKVQEVIEAVRQHFAFAPNGTYDLRLESNPNEALKPERTLVSYHLKDGDVLIFSDLGVGV
jgi:hypothetical protein